ncbi:hypothetical protein ATCC90586_001199 [Pythium insidiosum]|nr:hypothetical protein ATCC90586_001199 [Pythium insidiosum]
MDDINEAFLDTLDTLTSIRDGENGVLGSKVDGNALEAGDLRLSALSVDELSSDDDEFEIGDFNGVSASRMDSATTDQHTIPMAIITSNGQRAKWYAAIMAAVSLPQELIQAELRERVKIRNTFHGSVFRLRKLLKAHVKPEVNGPPKDQKTIDIMIRTLWELTFPEGFAGSAIQSAALERFSTWKTDLSGADPTVIFVHALNPYGFAHLRRNNEHNVDLNRNWLSDEELQTLAKRDANIFGYVDVYDLLNPSLADIESWMYPFVLKQIWHLATKGWSSFKRAVVTGNYHFPTSLFFGGLTKQPSILLLEDFLQRAVDFEAVERFAVVDVHTGLGKSGQETLFLTDKVSFDVMSRVFAREIEENIANGIANSTNVVTSGYDVVSGVVCDGVAQLVPADRRHHVLSVAQEFGTVPPHFVLKAMTEENAVYQEAPTRRLPYAERVRDVFYVHRSASWKRSVLDRGVALVHKLVAHLQQPYSGPQP